MYLVANWKCNKDLNQVRDWFYALEKEAESLSAGSPDMVICPPIIYLPILSSLILERGLNLSLGAQFVSGRGFGSYTGDICSEMILPWASYVLVGHSETRHSHCLSNEQVASCLDSCQRAGLRSIICVSDLDQITSLKEISTVPSGQLFAYEPLHAISRDGQLNPADPSEVKSFITAAKDLVPTARFLYGGSVSLISLNSFLDLPLAGFLIGQMSLDPVIFAQLAKKLYEFQKK
ncbi:hypothetical protein COT52_00620 [candidate division WWE3 bacterium CG08_land_8_20_14_0_20_43_13]|uniref:Triosephosphate isomerase n=1 Tax=candidate division WWE3 bacterium CG08_land_8_20_14_0_20_43_13 TaxID=1975087 RepID=A0A2H0X873_UNCKA|nr:MAG: hypothetical protein COT52_00620 [candidate division WWE3 bacterium CG08_land_8_20_14_0_20_43_13]